MTIYQLMTIEELQKLDSDDLAMMELGRRVVNFEMHQHFHDEFFCKELDEAYQAISDLESEPLPEDYEQIFDAGVRVGLEDAISLNA